MVGTHLVSSGPEFCVESTNGCLQIFFGDPFGDDFVSFLVAWGSGLRSHTLAPLWGVHLKNRFSV